MSSINTTSPINKYIINLSTPCSWVHLTLVFTSEIRYLRSSIQIINYPTLSTAIWGRDWMDGSIAFWMTFPFWEVFQMWNVLMDFIDFQYSWNISVNSYLISMRVTPLDLYKKCESGGYKYV